MHELSIALGIVDSLGSELADEPGRVISVGVEIGVLSGVVPDALEFAWEAASRGSRLEGSTLDITVIEAVVHCDRCDADRTLPSVDRLRCPVCETPTSDLVAGRDLRIRDVRMSSSPAPDNGPSGSSPTERGPTERGPTERGPTERGPTERGPTERGPTERGPTERGPTERGPKD